LLAVADARWDSDFDFFAGRQPHAFHRVAGEIGQTDGKRSADVLSGRGRFVVLRER
jgi:hypothetical protein